MHCTDGLHRLRICGILSLGFRKRIGAMRAKKEPPGIRAVQTGGMEHRRTIEAAEHRQGCGSAADSGGNWNPGSSAGDWCQSRVAENSGDRPVRLHPSPAGIGGRDSRCEENRSAGCGKGRPESVLSGTQAIKNGSRQKRFPFAPQHIQYTIFTDPCPFSVSPTFAAYSCVSSHLAKLGNLRYYEGTKKEWVQCTK